MRTIYFTLCSLIVVFTATAQKKQNLESFTTLDTFGPFEIELIKAESPSIVVDYRGVEEEDVLIDVHRDVLRLKLKNKHYIEEWKSSSHEGRRSQYIRVTLYYKELDVLEAEAGARIFSKETLRSRNLAIHASMGAEIELDIYSKNLYSKSSMGALLTLSGKVEKMELRGSMGSVVKATKLESKVAYVKSSMGSEFDIYVTDELEASASFGGTIDFTGGTSVRNTNSSMGGEINRRR